VRIVIQDVSWDIAQKIAGSDIESAVRFWQKKGGLEEFAGANEREIKGKVRRAG